MYDYLKMKPEVLEPKGQILLNIVRTESLIQLRVNNVFRADVILNMAPFGLGAVDNWLVLACFDRLIELGELRELATGDDPAQWRVFVRGPKTRW